MTDAQYRGGQKRVEAEVKRKTVVDQVFGDNKAPIVDVLNADFAELKAEVDAFVAQMREAAKAAPKTDEDQAALGKIIIDARALFNRADGKREVEKKPILDAGRSLDAWFKDMLASLVKGRDHLQGMAEDYALRKLAEERARAAREAEDARAKAEAERLRAEAAKTPQAAANAEARAEVHEARADASEATAKAADADLLRGRVGGVSMGARTVWSAKINDYQAAIAPLGAIGPFLKNDAVQAALNSMAKLHMSGAKWPGVDFSNTPVPTFRG